MKLRHWLLAALLTLAMWLACGCAHSGLRAVAMGPSETTTTVKAPDGTTTTTVQREAGSVNQEASAVGVFQPAATVNQAETGLAFEGVTVGAAGSIGAVASNAYTGPFFWAGLVFIAAGLALGLILKQWSWGLPIILIGGVLTAVGFLMARFPWVLLFLILAAAALGVLMLWKAGYLAKLKTAFVQVVAGVQEVKRDMTADERADMNVALASEQDKATQDLVAEAKSVAL